jgi:MSHA biogenesis protein MshQ
MRATGVLLLAGACNFTTHAAGPIDATDAPVIDAADAPSIDATDAAGGDGSGSAVLGRRKPITIDKTKIAGTVDDFPVWIDLTDADIAATARADGADIHFTDAMGAALDHEIQSWDPTAQRLRAWVRLPHLASNASTTIYVVYGADLVPQNPSGVFMNGFAAVWHLDDALVNTTVTDATGTHAGTAVGFTTGQQVAAQLGGGFSFDGTSRSKVTFTNPLLGNTPHTISAWVAQNMTTEHSAIVCVGTNGTAQARFLYANYLNSGTVGLGQYNDDWVPTGHDLRNQGWTLVHWVHEGNNKKSHIYIDGTEIAGGAHTMMFVPATAGTAGYIGYAPEPTFGDPTGMNGSLDEVRIATVVRNAAWIGTEHNNQASPGTFYSVGAEEPAP